jgi:uncharacterized membrane protein
LHPAAGYFESRLQAISDDGAQQVGISRVGNLTPFHAMLWNGTAASATDLHPAGSAFSDTIAYATDGTHQVGYGDIAQGFAPHALLWSGSAASVFDLQSVLPANFVYSQASSINGNLIYGWAQDVNSNYHAIVWTIPEPASAALFICFAVTLLVRHRVRISAPAESGVGYRGTPL